MFVGILRKYFLLEDKIKISACSQFEHLNRDQNGVRWFPLIICFLYLLNFTNLWRRVWRTSPQIEPLQVIRCKPGLQLGTRFLTLASTGLFDMSKCVMSGTYFNPKMRKLWTCNETLCATHFPDEYPFTLYVSTPEARLVQNVSCISNVTTLLENNYHMVTGITLMWISRMLHLRIPSWTKLSKMQNWTTGLFSIPKCEFEFNWPQHEGVERNLNWNEKNGNLLTGVY